MPQLYDQAVARELAENFLDHDEGAIFTDIDFTLTEHKGGPADVRIVQRDIPGLLPVLTGICRVIAVTAQSVDTAKPCLHGATGAAAKAVLREPDGVLYLCQFGTQVLAPGWLTPVLHPRLAEREHDALALAEDLVSGTGGPELARHGVRITPGAGIATLEWTNGDPAVQAAAIAAIEDLTGRIHDDGMAFAWTASSTVIAPRLENGLLTEYKRWAVRHVLEREPVGSAIGCGDSAGDLAFCQELLDQRDDPRTSTSWAGVVAVGQTLEGPDGSASVKWHLPLAERATMLARDCEDVGATFKQIVQAAQ